MQHENRYTVSGHAIARFQQRVTPMSSDTAHQAIETIAATSRRRSRPRHWMRHIDNRNPDATYLYNHRVPDVCLIARDNIIVTVYTRTVCKRWQAAEPRRISRRDTKRARRHIHSRTSHGNSPQPSQRPIHVPTRKEM